MSPQALVAGRRLVEKMKSPAGEEVVGWDEEEEQQESESDAGEGGE
jgi:hypothetical protein